MSEPMSLREVADRLAIQDLLTLYAEMVDTRNWTLLDRVFTPDAQLDYTSTGGVAGDARTVMAWLDRALEPWPVNLHCITNVQIVFDDDGATSKAAFHAPMATGELGSQYAITNAGYYEDLLVATPEGWRIRERVCNQILMVGSLPDEYEIPD
jgi:3-phenylpropionate/cinnamic acid dioxygenase small subunit